MVGHQTKATKLFESSKSSSGPSGFGKKLETKALKGAEDDKYSSEEKSDDERKGGVRGRSASSNVSSDISPSPLYIPPHHR